MSYHKDCNGLLTEHDDRYSYNCMRCGETVSNFDDEISCEIDYGDGHTWHQIGVLELGYRDHVAILKNGPHRYKLLIANDIETHCLYGLSKTQMTAIAEFIVTSLAENSAHAEP